MNAMTARLVNSSKASCDKKSSKSGALPATPRPSDGRRANKPLMEKRRRARINQSLAVLKTLILDSARLENTKHSKLEKADILELTVRHLQRQRTLSSSVLSKYRAGFQECTREVSRFLESSDLLSPTSSSSSPAPPPLEPGLKQRLLRHLDSCVAELDLDFGLCAAPDQPESSVKAEADSEARPDSSTTSGGDENNNSNSLPAPVRPASSCGKASPVGSAVVSGSESPEPEMDAVVATTSSSSSSSSANPLLSVVQVIPSRLPDGQVVFLLPSHYVQLAAAAGAVWGTSPEKSKPEEEEDDDSPDQPIDFTVSRRAEDDSVKDEGPVWRPW